MKRWFQVHHKEINRYFQGKDRIEVVFAGEVYACDPSITEMTVPEVAVFLPRRFIRWYNRKTEGRDSQAPPDAERMWRFLCNRLRSRRMQAPDEYGTPSDVNETLKELSEWPHGAVYESPFYSRRGVMLQIKAEYDPYWDDEDG